MGCVSSRSCRIRAPAIYSGQPCTSCSKREDIKIESLHAVEANASPLRPGVDFSLDWGYELHGLSMPPGFGLWLQIVL